MNINGLADDGKRRQQSNRFIRGKLDVFGVTEIRLKRPGER